MLNNLAIGLLLSKYDLDYTKGWLARHDKIGQHIIIGLDGISTDDIPLVTYNSTSRVNFIDTPLNNDFAAARNKILEKSKDLGCEYTLFLDADELLLPNTRHGIDVTGIISHLKYNNDVTHAAFLRYNIFGRHLIDFPNYHPCFCKNSTSYINHSPVPYASPGCHEMPKGRGSWMNDIFILHLKETWESNFRGKGYCDIRNEEALEDLQKKINLIK